MVLENDVMDDDASSTSSDHRRVSTSSSTAKLADGEYVWV